MSGGDDPFACNDDTSTDMSGLVEPLEILLETALPWPGVRRSCLAANDTRYHRTNSTRPRRLLCYKSAVYEVNTVTVIKKLSYSILVHSE